MTSAIEDEVPVASAPILWITGLSGVGKSTLARALCAALRTRGHRPLLLDGDGLRDVLEPDDAPVDHAPAKRRMRAWRLARLARMAAVQGVPVVAATMSLLHDVQAWNREGPAPYAEVLLHADLDLLTRRNPALYQAAGGNVVGIDIPAEFPLQPELVLVQVFAPSDMAAQCTQVLDLWDRLAALAGRPKPPGERLQ